MQTIGVCTNSGTTLAPSHLTLLLGDRNGISVAIQVEVFSDVAIRQNTSETRIDVLTLSLVLSASHYIVSKNSHILCVCLHN